MAKFEANRLYIGVPGTGETTLYTAVRKTKVRSIHLSGDATGGNITVHLRPGGVAASAANALAQAFAVGIAGVAELVTIIAGGEGFVAMNPGDVLSALQSAGTHITASVSGDVETGG